MNGVAEPALILQQNASPHSYHLKPSQGRAIQRADLIFWIGPPLETFLIKPLQNVSKRARIVALIDTDLASLLPARRAQQFGTLAKADHDHDHHSDHSGGAPDPHIWLDPKNAAAMSATIASELTRIDPDHAAQYQANLNNLIADLDQLTEEIQTRLRDRRGIPAVVFHDAYQYFEKRFGLTISGAITLHPESPPSARHIASIRDRAAADNVACALTEPQFDDRLITAITKSATVRLGQLDPMGQAIEPGPGQYAAMLRAMAQALHQCLQPR